jgi:hypothetical protein
MHNSDVPPERPSPARFVLGGGIFFGGQLAPLLIPVVASSNLGGVWKTAISAVLFISPELFILVAAAVLGKPGFNYLTGALKRALGRFFEKHGPPDTVSRTRYRVGLIMFAVPLLFGWATPYVIHHLPGYESNPLLYGLPFDMLLVASLFVLGGDFWDKQRALFVHRATARFAEKGKP